MNPRHRRLVADYNELRRRFDGDSHVHIQPFEPVPYERYRITYAVPSLRLSVANQPVVAPYTVVDITLPLGYPREKPFAVTTEQVFHPNFGEHICLADYWSPAQTLADIVAEIAELLQWQRYNVRSPLNAVAANWVRNHAHEVPLGTIRLGRPDVNVRVQPGGGM